MSSADGPRQQIERVIIKVWAEALGVEQVGLDENIFDLGATSLMMPEVQIELRRSLVVKFRWSISSSFIR